MKTTESERLFDRARRCIPGGVNSPVRACGSIGMTPRFISRAEGSRIYDADQNAYTDYIGSWGPMILGHDHPKVREAVIQAAENGLSFGAATAMEVEMAELMKSMVPSLDLVRMVNSGTEAVMSAIRTARGFTGRDKIIKFKGCYHGHSDALLVKAGSGGMTFGVPDSAGVPEGSTRDTLTADYNDLTSVQALFELYPEDIAAVIVEPVAANMGVVPPEDGFLQGLRDITTKYHSLLIFDEVITGFRLGTSGAQGYYGIQPDLTTFGKIIGAGMPVGAYGGKKEIMEMVSPVGAVYQAGTLSGNPVAMAAGFTQLRILKEHPEYYEKLNKTADWFFETMQNIIHSFGYAYPVNHVGSVGTVFFTEQKVRDYADAKSSDTELFADYCRTMIDAGNYLGPSQFEAIFLSMAHTKEQLEKTLDDFTAWLKKRGGRS